MNEKEKVFDLKNMVLMALFIAVTCVLAPLSIPIGPVPISLTNFVIYFELYFLGWKRGLISYVVYLLLGMVGLLSFPDLPVVWANWQAQPVDISSDLSL